MGTNKEMATSTDSLMHIDSIRVSDGTNSSIGTELNGMEAGGGSGGGRCENEKIKSRFNQLLISPLDKQQMDQGFHSGGGMHHSGDSTSAASGLSFSSSLTSKDQSFWDNNMEQFSRTLLYDPLSYDRKVCRLEQVIKSPTFIMVIFLRRFGCPVCRAVTTGLMYLFDHVLRPLLKDNIKLVAIACEEIGVDEFVRQQYLHISSQRRQQVQNVPNHMINDTHNGIINDDGNCNHRDAENSFDHNNESDQQVQLFVNPSGTAFSLLSLKKLSLSNAYGLTNIQKMKAAVNLASDSYFKQTSDFNGNYVQLGGLFIFRNSGHPTFDQECIFEHKEGYAGDTPLVLDIMKVFGLDDATFSPSQLSPEFEHILSLFQGDDLAKLRVLHLAQRAAQEKKIIQKKQRGLSALPLQK
ncbi:hypothetical protein MP228_009355 [Amoeboaphelidium protococcarum]|nr:hypothetical protein MP228_009355 [Amoeboaphelidium protococcarum]